MKLTLKSKIYLFSHVLKYLIVAFARKKSKLPDSVEELKSKANTYFENGYYYDAIRYYNKAIAKIPNSEVLYGNRAAALMKRNW